MERFWKWLMRTDARSIFVVSLLLLLAVSAWRAWVHLQPVPEIEAVSPQSSAKEVKFSAYRPLGIIALVSNQFAAQTLVVPVNPFRPTFEAMVRNPESGDLESVISGGQGGGPRWGGSRERGGGEGEGGGGPRWSRGGGRHRPGETAAGGGEAEKGGQQVAAGAPPRYAYRGMFERPDGRIAAYVTSSEAGGRFLAKGDRLGSAEVVEATAQRIALRCDDGRTVELLPGAPPLALEVQE